MTVTDNLQEASGWLMQSLGVCYDDVFFLKEVRVLLSWKKSRWKEEGTRIKLTTSLHYIIRKKLDKTVISGIYLDDRNTSLLATANRDATAICTNVQQHQAQPRKFNRKCFKLVIIKKPNYLRELKLMADHTQVYSLPVKEDFHIQTHTPGKKTIKPTFSRILGQFLKEIL